MENHPRFIENPGFLTYRDRKKYDNIVSHLFRSISKLKQIKLRYRWYYIKKNINHSSEKIVNKYFELISICYFCQWPWFYKQILFEITLLEVIFDEVETNVELLIHTTVPSWLLFLLFW